MRLLLVYALIILIQAPLDAEEKSQNNRFADSLHGLDSSDSLVHSLCRIHPYHLFDYDSREHPPDEPDLDIPRGGKTVPTAKCTKTEQMHHYLFQCSVPHADLLRLQQGHRRHMRNERSRVSRVLRVADLREPSILDFHVLFEAKKL